MKIDKFMYATLMSLKELLNDENANKKPISHDKLGISYREWSYLIEIMLDEGLIKGYREVKVDGAPFPIYIETKPAITYKGLKWLEENKPSAKVLEFFKNIKDATPGF